MLRSFALIALLGYTSAFLYVNPKCHEGPAYWCSSPEVAESCQATTFCNENIWMKQVGGWKNYELEILMLLKVWSFDSATIILLTKYAISGAAKECWKFRDLQGLHVGF